MALITTTRPNSKGEVSVIITGKYRPVTRTIVNRYITRSSIKVDKIYWKTALD